nr:putative S-adenosyl-L-methionine-dependent methyltransferases superfamily protein [Ipomoea batatas]
MAVAQRHSSACSSHFVPGPGLAGFAAGFTGSVTALSAVCLFVAAGNIFYSSVPLHWEMAQRMVNAVGDWSTVKHALDLGCDRGILLNAVALQLKKSGSSGRVVGLHPAQSRSLSVLRTAGMEGVQEYVTCRAGDPRTLPFADNCFDVVASAAGGGAGTEARRRRGGVGPSPRTRIREETSSSENGGHSGLGAGHGVHGQQPHRIIPEAKSALRGALRSQTGLEIQQYLLKLPTILSTRVET